MDSSAARRWTEEATRLHDRYQIEVVEACGLCPWAERARVGKAFQAHVLLQTDTRDIDSSLASIDVFTADPRVEVGVLIYPQLRLTRLEFERYVASVRERDAARHEIGRIPFVFAAFHPDAEPDTRDAERLIPFLRRTPDPTIQLLRTSALDRVRSGTPQGTQFVDLRTFEQDMTIRTPVPLRQRIATANLITVERMGILELAKRIDAIALDRNVTYRSLEARKDESPASAKTSV